MKALPPAEKFGSDEKIPENEIGDPRIEDANEEAQ
jgi:hypothetical protein